MEPVFESYEKQYNSDTETKLRRYKSNLALSGAAYVAFGFWSVIKILASLTMDPKLWEELMEVGRAVEGATDDIIKPVFALLFLIIFAVILFIHLRIGISAMRYSAGRQRSWFFLVVAGILLYLAINDVSSGFGSFGNNAFDQLQMDTSSVIVSLTVCFILFDMIYSVIRIRQLSKKKKQEGAAV